MAILRHETPDGGAHFDLLLAGHASVGDDERSVPTWRCESDPMALPDGARTRAASIAPHRGLYLRLEAPHQLGEGRGIARPAHRGVHWIEGDTRILQDAMGRMACLRFVHGWIERRSDADQVKAS